MMGRPAERLREVALAGLSGLARRLWSLPKASHRVSVIRGVTAPMRDGVVLVTDIYAPIGGSHPTVLIRSPFGRGAIFGLAGRLPLSIAIGQAGTTLTLSSTNGLLLDDGPG